jgi:hypothetical protein
MPQLASGNEEGGQDNRAQDQRIHFGFFGGWQGNL